jgi:hypothetical protein
MVTLNRILQTEPIRQEISTCILQVQLKFKIVEKEKTLRPVSKFASRGEVQP